MLYPFICRVAIASNYHGFLIILFLNFDHVTSQNFHTFSSGTSMLYLYYRKRISPISFPRKKYFGAKDTHTQTHTQTDTTFAIV